jgi:uncharacterized damage-inducible protein DinB
MNIPETYDYLMRARRDLWAALESTPDELLSRPLLDGSRFHCIKDLVLHIADVEDGWIHGDILREPMLQDAFPVLRNAEGPVCAGFALEMLLDYWRLVERNTLTYLPTLTDQELKRLVIVDDTPGKEERFTVDGLLWHVMIHEMRHTAQIAVLLRTQGIKPPSLDLLFYLPSA